MWSSYIGAFSEQVVIDFYVAVDTVFLLADMCHTLDTVCILASLYCADTHTVYCVNIVCFIFKKRILCRNHVLFILYEEQIV